MRGPANGEADGTEAGGLDDVEEFLLDGHAPLALGGSLKRVADVDARPICWLTANALAGAWFFDGSSTGSAAEARSQPSRASPNATRPAAFDAGGRKNRQWLALMLAAG